MKTAIKERLDALRAAMRNEGLNAYYITNSDYHGSEYSAAHFCALRYFSGFTGSFGILVLTLEEAMLYTDGRYLLQAEAELEGTGISHISMGSREQAVKSFLLEHLSAGDRLGLDCRTLSCSEYEALFDALRELGLKLKCSKAAYSAWQARPLLKTEHAFLLDKSYSGKPASEKLFDLRKEMKLLGAKVHVIASLSDIAWLFNLRGDYTQYSPVLLSYAVIEECAAYLFADAKALEPSLLYALKELKVEVLPYGAIYSFFSSYQKGARALLSRHSINCELMRAVEKSCEIIDAPNPTIYQKAKKNPIELKNLRKAHINDGIALTNLIFSLKKELHLFKDEYSVSLRLEQLRKEQEGFVSPSFATIAAYGENAAIVHYQPQAEGSKALLGEGFLLLDSGGHYYLGTTDITRTISLGALSDEQRHLYTLVLKGLLRLSFARFPKGTKGYALDAFARSALWNEGLDYDHGTGHGVGYFLNVHEPPNSISRSHLQSSAYTGILEPAMVTSCEPGVYIKGSFGIRLENLLLCKESAHDGFLEFETLSLAPFDHEAIDASLLCKDERALLNSYHRRVYEALAPHLSEACAAWLLEETKAL